MLTWLGDGNYLIRVVAALALVALSVWLLTAPVRKRRRHLRAAVADRELAWLASLAPPERRGGDTETKPVISQAGDTHAA